MVELRILDEAAQEVAAAASYLEQQRTGYGLLFMKSYEQKLAQITRFPTSGPPLSDSPDGHELRSLWIRKFGYSIMVGVIGEALTVVAVMHHSRAPGY